jgi:hypothetical protein
MTDASLPAGRFSQGDFRVGHVFSLTWSVFSRNFLTFMLVTGIASLPALFFPRSSPGDVANPFQNLGWPLVGLIFLMIVLGTLSQAVVLYGAFQVMRGRPINLVESAAVGLRRFFPIVGIAISVSCLVGLASVLLIVPGVMLYLMWSVATSVCVVEQLGPFRSMGRSRELTRGHRWKIFGLILLTVIPAGIVGLIVSAVAVGALGTVMGLPSALVGPLGQVVGLLWGAVWKAFYVILAVVIYHDLRVAKEGVDTEKIAAVFE